MPNVADRPRLLLISQPNSYRIAPYLAAGRRMGLDVVIASRGEFSLITEVHDGLHVDLDDPVASVQTLLDHAAKWPFAGILGSDDSTVELAASVAARLGLPHNPPGAAKLSRRKDLARASLAMANCPVPRHRLIDLKKPLEQQANGLPWPCVLKPLYLSASRGVIRVNGIDAFVVAAERIATIVEESSDPFERSHLLAERYIDGEEVAYEGYLHDSTLHTLALFDKPDPLVGPYFDETIYVTPSLLSEATQARIRQRVAEACRAYGLTTGPVHAELRIDEQDAWILEIASRTIGGDCGRTLDNGQDFTVEELAISLAMGKPMEAKPACEATGVMMIPVKKAGLLRQVEGVAEARQVRHIEKVDIIMAYGHELIPLPEGNQYLGYIFARAETSSEVTEALRTAYAKLDVRVASLFRPEIA